MHTEASMLFGPDPVAWPPELQAEQATAMPLWAEIKRLRARSNEIEMMEPLPTELASDDLWDGS